MDDTPATISFSKMRKKQFTLETLKFFGIDLSIKTDNKDIYTFSLVSISENNSRGYSLINCEATLLKFRGKQPEPPLNKKYLIVINTESHSGYLKII